MSWFARYKTRIYVKIRGKYYRVTGPTKLLDSVHGLGGYIVIGEEFAFVSGIFMSGSNSFTDQSINGFSLHQMEHTPITADDKKLLGI